MSNPWKTLAFAFVTIALLLSAALLVLLLRRTDELSTAKRRLVEEQVRLHLAQGEPEKAAAALEAMPDDLESRAAADRARLEIAPRSEPERAVTLLDAISTAGHDPAETGRIVRARLDAVRRLFETKVLRDGDLPAPYEPRPFRLEPGLPPDPADVSRVAARLLACLDEARDATRREGAAPDPALGRLAALARAARYAVGEIPYADVRPADDESRVRFGDLLFRERQFDRAIETWTPVLGDPRVRRKLAGLAALRRHAPERLKLWDYEIDRILGKDPALEAEASAQAEALFRKARLASTAAPARPAERVVERREIPRDIDSADEPAIFIPENDATLQSFSSNAPIVDPTDDPAQLYLLDEFQGFQLEVPSDRPFTTRSGASLRLTSAFGGPIRARLFRAPDLETLHAIDAASLPSHRAKLAPVREWEIQFSPLQEPAGHQPPRTLEVPDRAPGLYVLVADARYCPVLAVATFIITDVYLVQQVDAGRVLVFAADRATGSPHAGLPLAIRVTGRYELAPADLLPPAPGADAAAAGIKADEHRRGFDAGWAGQPPEPDATSSYRSGHRQALALRARCPDTGAELRGVTGADGLLDQAVAPAFRAGYRYTVLTATAGSPHYSRVETPFNPDEQKTDLKALVYADRPVYRPGDAVQYKAILRRFDGEGLLPYDGAEALVEISCYGRTVHAATRPVTDFGTASGSLALPPEAQTGAYEARVNNGPLRPLFRVEEYRKPDFEIVFDHPARVREGEPVEIAMLVRYYTGDPAAGATVDLTLSRAPQPSAKALSDDITRTWYYPTGSRDTARWTTAYRHTMVTDAAGRGVFRFQPRAGSAGWQHKLTAFAYLDNRSVTAESRLEVAGESVAIRFETDRPTYFPGEVARLHILVSDAPAGATHLRVEERKVEGLAKDEAPFKAAVELKEGRATVEYRVPYHERDLQAAVRLGETWLWTPVPLDIVARTSAGGALTVRTDRSVYRVGETARLFVKSNEPDTHVLLVTATGRIHHRQVVPLRGDTEAEVPLEIRPEDVPNVVVRALAVRADRLLEGTCPLRVPPVDRFLSVEIETDRGGYRPGETCRAVVRVKDAAGRPVPECELSLGVVDEALYAFHPDLTPDLREYFHRYERSLSVRCDSFFREAPGAFLLWKAPLFVRGRAAVMGVYDTMGVGSGGGGGGRYGGRFGGRENLVTRGGGSAGITPSRSIFHDTAHWSAHLKTGADGTAAVSFAFPDSLTAFRFTARGLTRDTKVGSVTQRAVVRKPFYVHLAVPRVLQEGSAIALHGLVHNYTGRTQEARVEVRCPFPVLRSAIPDPLVLAAGAVGKVEVLVDVDHFLPGAAITLGAAVDGGPSDAMTLTVPGRRRGTPFREGRAGSIAGGEMKEEVFRLPPDAVPGTASLVIRFDAGLHAAIVEALEPLIDYPYGCVEQTMSRFLPAVAAGRALGVAPHRWSDKLPRVIADGLCRLYHFQHSDGGWGWWRNDTTSEAMTAYVLYGLAQCRKAGVAVNRDAMDRAATLLRDRLEKRLGGSTPSSGRVPLPSPVDLRAYAALALAEHESAWGAPTDATKQLVASLAGLPEERPPADDLLIALACQRLGMPEAGEAARLRAAQRPATDILAASLFLQLQAGRPDAASSVGATVRLLLSKRAGKGWRTTMEGAYAILGLASILDRPAAGGLAAPGRVFVSVNGAPAKELLLPDRVDPSFDGRIDIPEPEAGWGEKAVVRLRFEGRGTACYAADLAGLAKEAETAATGTGGTPDGDAPRRALEITRAYYEEQDGGWIPAGPSVRAGRRVLVQLAITSADARDYVMVTDPRPDGFEPEGANRFGLKGSRRTSTRLSDTVDLSSGWEARLDAFRRDVRGDAKRESDWALALLREIFDARRFAAVTSSDELILSPGKEATSVEHRDDRTLFFLDAIPAGTTCLYYIARPEFTGDFRARPPEVSPMYEPEIRGAGVPARLAVRGGTLLPEADAPPAPPVPLAAGVAGLRPVVDALAAADADALIEAIPAKPPIGKLLLRVATASALRAWLAIDAETAAVASAGAGLRERIEAARKDLRTRRMALESLENTQPLPEAVAAEALGDDRLARRILEGTGPAAGGDAAAIDNALLWAREDQAFRLLLLTAVLKRRGSVRLDGLAFRSVTVARVLDRLGDRAPSGDARARWLLGQKIPLENASLGDLRAICERDLGLPVQFQGNVEDSGRAYVYEQTMGVALDRVLLVSGLYCRVRDGAVIVGRLEDLVDNETEGRSRP